MALVHPGLSGKGRELTRLFAPSRSGAVAPAVLKAAKRSRVAAQLRFWPPDAILDAVNRLQDAELAVKTGAADDETQCAQTLLGICIRGRALKR